jgi:uncharacterized protein YdeI (YjbR/CyaY-like superfamily)
MSTQKLFLHFENAEDWRTWLWENYAKHHEVWLIFFKNKTGKQNISYESSVEEALCFGWIDSIIKKLDEDRYARKYTPRTNNHNWSELNIRRVKKLTSEGKMEDAGLSKIDHKLYDPIKRIFLNEDHDPKKNPDTLWVVPEFVINFFGENEPALKNFNAMAPSHKKHYVLWITNAKTEPTVKKRLMEAVLLLKENKKLGLK